MTAVEFLNTLIPTTLEKKFPLEFQVKQLRKGEILTNYGEVEKRIYFIKKGIIELTILAGSEEKIIDFFFPNSFVCSYTSFINQQKSDVQVRTIVDCEVEYLNRFEVQAAYDQSMTMNKIGRLLTEQMYIMKSDREKDFLTKSAETRYLELIEKKGELVKLVPVNRIARYLGIHPESLSRIRKSIS
uniref:Crp/Fnr family transcriptional regulator n=1 Tax=Roseivirga sp. TaxID=1964215 RepID=UPI004048401D